MLRQIGDLEAWRLGDAIHELRCVDCAFLETFETFVNACKAAWDDSRVVGLERALLEPSSAVSHHLHDG